MDVTKCAVMIKNIMNLQHHIRVPLMLSGVEYKKKLMITILLENINVQRVLSR